MTSGRDPAGASTRGGSPRLYAIAPFLVFALLGGLFGYRLFNPGESAPPSQAIGRPAPAFDIPTLQAALDDQLDGGARLTQSDLATGDVVVLNFWASWCAPCRIEHPHLMRLSAEGVRVVGIAYNDVAQDSRGFLDELGDPFQTVGFDAQGRVGITWGLTGVPETFVLNGSGEVTFRHVGPIQNDDLNRLILPAIAAARG